MFARGLLQGEMYVSAEAKTLRCWLHSGYTATEKRQSPAQNRAKSLI